jgi:hypothetical protein
VLTLIAVALLAACGTTPATPAAPAASQSPQVAVTALANDTAPTRAPTSTLGPTVASITQHPGIAQALELAKNGKYEAAVALLRPIYLEFQSNNGGKPSAELDTLQEQLAGIYLAWGRTTVAESKGDLRQIAFAYDHFNDGVTIAPSTGSTRDALEAEHKLSATMIEAAQLFDQLKTATPDVKQRPDADRMVQLLGQVRSQQANYPGLLPLHVDALLFAAKNYENSPGTTTEDQKVALKQALAYCNDAKSFDAQRQDASTCVERVRAKLAQLNAPPTAPPDPSILRFSVVNYNDDPTCISVQIRGIKTNGWFFTVDGLRLRGNFDGGGNARLCGLGNGQQVTITVFNGAGRVVAGGGGVPSKGSAIMAAVWR